MRTHHAVLVITTWLGSSVAIADDTVAEPYVVDGVNTTGLTYGSVETMSETSVRGVAKEWMILPEGMELSSELKFVTSDPSLGAEPLAFSDVALMSLGIKSSVYGKVELFGSVDILPKQPSWADEKIWQGASLGLRGQLGRHQVAVSARAAAGPMLGDLGYWGQATFGVNARKRLHEIMTFEGAVTGAGTYLLPDDEMRDPAWLAEAGVTGSVLFRDPTGHSGAWLGVGYALPLAHAGREPMTDASLDPQPRLDLHIGAVVSMVDAWDLFADYAVIDRGDLGAMATRLPILDGGFDQRQLIIGLTYHVKAKNPMSAAALIQN